MDSATLSRTVAFVLNLDFCWNLLQSLMFSLKSLPVRKHSKQTINIIELRLFKYKTNASSKLEENFQICLLNVVLDLVSNIVLVYTMLTQNNIHHIRQVFLLLTFTVIYQSAGYITDGTLSFFNLWSIFQLFTLCILNFKIIGSHLSITELHGRGLPVNSCLCMCPSIHLYVCNQFFLESVFQ